MLKCPVFPLKATVGDVPVKQMVAPMGYLWNWVGLLVKKEKVQYTLLERINKHLNLGNLHVSTKSLMLERCIECSTYFKEEIHSLWAFALTFCLPSFLWQKNNTALPSLFDLPSPFLLFLWLSEFSYSKKPPTVNLSTL